MALNILRSLSIALALLCGIAPAQTVGGGGGNLGGSGCTSLSAPCSAQSFNATGSSGYQIDGTQTHWGVTWDSGGAPAAGGTSYASGDVVTLTGGNCAVEPTVSVTAVSGGVITKYVIQRQGDCTLPPANPVSQGSTTGSGSGATFNLQWTLPPRFVPFSADGINTTAYGYLAGSSLTTGNEYTAVGYNACAAVTTGSENTCLGWQAGGSQNGGFNVFVGGAGVLLGSSSGSHNTLVGDVSARHVSNINFSTLIGSETAYTAVSNPIWFWTCVGESACYYNDNGSIANITAVGAHAAFGATSGASFTGITALGANSGAALTTATNMTLLGGGASHIGNAVCASGSGVVLIGSGNVTVDCPAGNTSNYINIENILTVTGTNTPSTSVSTIAGTAILAGITADTGHTDATVCEDTTTHQFYSGTGTLGVCLGTSSRRYKNDIGALPDELNALLALDPREFTMKDGHGVSGKVMYGFYAEDAVKIFPDLVGLNQDGQPNTFDYIGLVPVLVKAVQQQQAEIDAVASGRDKDVADPLTPLKAKIDRQQIEIYALFAWCFVMTGHGVVRRYRK